ncbi:uncharacterized protein N0V89_001045 [Didymosphaeria variabile]|uniref:DOC domain-containing protein n=1 Tax=Didymosphaeria variabile TaxID=1932322 RepID=A0A9W8XXP4_9PLEO|nr:uncharacterized protein N0V89_001045 [Didymosphaeria variabile]KAJ4360480.1 hypothetical protein N0V89_001045 [Didymosphaeria variabile]
MPSLRRRGQPQPSPSPQEVLSESDEEYVSADASDDGQEQELHQQVEQALVSDEEQAGPLSPGSEPSEPPLSPSHLSAALPPDLREISTLASWTVSSSKPGCSIPQLRHPSPSLFWQSDGPQPHYLNIHFFKLVRIVGLRLYLDFEQDESYTPTRIVLLAGSGMNDLVEWGEMRLESPRGWVWADFSGVGDPDDDEDDSEDEDGTNEVDMPDANPTAEAQRQTFRDAPPTDDVSDFENTAPRVAPTATPIPANNGSLPLDTQVHHQTVTPVGLTTQNTPSSPARTPRPFCHALSQCPAPHKAFRNG